MVNRVTSIVPGKLLATFLTVLGIGAAIAASPIVHRAEAQSSSLLSPVSCHNEGAQDVKTYLCDGNFSGGLCASGFYRNVAFTRSYTTPPKVIVTPHNISDQGGCVGGTTDKVVCKAENITTTGFRLVCHGSPEGSACGAHSGWATYASADWLALEDSAACKTAGANNLTTSICTGTNAGGLCSGAFMQRVTFEKPFTYVPHVLTTAENLSNQGGCVGGATDKLICNPANISTTGFDLLCSGSPSNSCGDKAGWKTVANAGFIAKESTDFCKVESGHGIESEHCPGSQVGNVCSKAFEKRIVFTKLYSSPPKVIVSAEDITSAGTPCAQGATDKVICYAKDVTTIGFTAVCSGSPEGGHAAYTKEVSSPAKWVCEERSGHFEKKKGCEWKMIPQPPTTVVVPATQCGEYEGWNTKAKFGYLVVDNQCSGGQVSSSSSLSTSSVSTSSSSLSSSSSSAVSSSSSSSINNCIYYPWLCSSSSVTTSSSSSSSSLSSSSISSSISISSSVSSIIGMGCIDLIKETYDTAGNPLYPVTQFHFRLDQRPETIRPNNGNGRVRFENVTPGYHTIEEETANGWTLYSVTPENGRVFVQSGTNCAVVTFKNLQVVSVSSSSSSSSRVYQCSDNIDNDGDGQIDYPNDIGCDSPQDDNEWNQGSSSRRSCDLTIDKDASTGEVFPGGSIHYTLEITNDTGGDLRDVRVTDSFPHRDLVITDDDDADENRNGELSWVIRDLRDGDTEKIRYLARVRTTVRPGVTIRNNAEVDSQECSDEDTANVRVIGSLPQTGARWTSKGTSNLTPLGAASGGGVPIAFWLLIGVAGVCGGVVTGKKYFF